MSQTENNIQNLPQNALISDKNEIPYEILGEDAPSHDLLYKIIIIGDVAVGKSCLMLRGTKDEFREDHSVTLAVDFGSLSIKMENKIVKLQIWDTAGQEAFQSVAKVFYKGAHCIFLVYDITRAETFEKIKKWLHEVREASSENTLVILVGNMLDLEDMRTVPKEKALELKGKENLDAFIETSAKTGLNVKQLFVKVAQMLYSRDDEKDIKNEKISKNASGAQKVRISKSVKKDNKKCC